MGVRTEPEDPSPLWAGLSVQFVPPIGDGRGCMEAEEGTLKPASNPPRCHAYLKTCETKSDMVTYMVKPKSQ